MKLHEYDFCVMILERSISQSEIHLYTEMKRSGKEIFLVRNKFDLAIVNKSEHEARKSIQNYFDGNFEKVVDVYFISSIRPKEFDFPKLQLDLVKKLSEINKIKIIKNMAANSDEILELKKINAYKLVKFYSYLAAVNGLNPIPGLDISIDLGLLVKLSHEIRSNFSLDEENISFFDNNDDQSFKGAIKQEILKRLGRFLTTEGVMVLLKRYAVGVTSKQMVKYIPFIGQIVAAGIGYKMTHIFGEDVINETYELAKEVHNKAMHRSYDKAS